MSTRDSQRQKVYDAENKARRLLTNLGFEWRDVKTEARYRRRIDEIMSSKWMAEHYPDAVKQPVSLDWSRTKRGGACAGFDGITTSITDWSLHELVLVHELTHTIEKRTLGVYDPGHGRFFCELYLKLVRRFISAKAFEMLRKCFREGGVKYLPKRKRSTPDGVKVELPPALAAMNAKRVAAAVQKHWHALNTTGVQVMGRRGWCIGETYIMRDFAGDLVVRMRSDTCQRGVDLEMANLTPEDAYRKWKNFLGNCRN